MSGSSNQDIYIIAVEVEVLAASDIYEGHGHMFCFVSCFCCADDKQDAIGRIKRSLSQDGLKLKTIERIDLYRDSNWKEDDQDEVNQCANVAFETGETIYSRFSCYYK